MSDRFISKNSREQKVVDAPLPGKREPLIVIIDDDEMVRGLAVSVLIRLGKVVAAANGQDGIILCQQYAPDLVFLDINMPGMDGLEVLKQIMGLNKNTRVIMFSARSTGTNVEMALKMGAKGFITKPFTANILQERTAQALSDLGG
jgi:CheY-like chemotaxis protein